MAQTRRAIADALAMMPGSDAMARQFALAPPALKIKALSRLVSAIASRHKGAQQLLETNLGVSADFRLLLPASKRDLNFGRPDHILSERATIELIRRLASLSGPFLDVGANEGIFTFSVAANRNGAEQQNIHIFEPDEELFERLKTNLARNHIPAVINNVAVSNRSGRQIFYRNLSDDSSGSLATTFRAKHETVEIDVETITLAQYFDRHGLRNACVKVDVEGAGLAVWSGVGGAIAGIDWLIMEIIGPELENNVPRRIIREAGWQAWYVCDFDLIESTDGEYTYVEPFYNWLFTPKSRSELAAALAGTRFRIIDAPQKLPNQ